VDTIGYTLPRGEAEKGGDWAMAGDVRVHILSRAGFCSQVAPKRGRTLPSLF
jgi:hypothetical protein